MSPRKRFAMRTAPLTAHARVPPRPRATNTSHRSSSPHPARPVAFLPQVVDPAPPRDHRGRSTEMLAAVLHLSTAMPKPSAAALKPAVQMDATLVTKLDSGGWKCARLSMSRPAPT